MAIFLGTAEICAGAEDLLVPLATITVDRNGAAGEVDGLALSPDGRFMAASDNLATAHTYDITNLKNIQGNGRVFRHTTVSFAGRQLPSGEMNAIDFSPDGRWLVTGVDNAGAKLWNFETGAEVGHLDNGTNCDAASFSPDGKWLASAADNRLVVRPFDTATGKVGQVILSDPHSDSGEVNSIDWTSDSQRVASGGLKVVKVHQVGTPSFTRLHEIPNESSNGSVKSVRISPDDALLAIGARDARARVFDIATGSIEIDLPHEGNRRPLSGDDQDANVAIEAVAWSSDGAYLFTSGLIDGVMRVWRRDDWSLVGWAQAQEPKRAVEMIAVHGDRVAVGGDEGVVRLYQFNSPPVRSRIAFPRDGEPLLTIEAEDYDTNLSQGRHRWKREADAEASGGQFLQARPDDARQYDDRFQTYDPTVDSPKLDYRVSDLPAGTYHAWVRGRGQDTERNSLYLGFNNSEETAVAIKIDPPGQWQWIHETIEAPVAGDYTWNVWMREAGVDFDRFILTQDAAFDPASMNEGRGPGPRNQRVPRVLHQE